MSYIELPDWKPVVADKHLIFDTDVIIGLVEFKSLNLLDIMKDLNATFSYINPVYLELMNTDSPKLRLERSALLAEHEFGLLPTTSAEIELATRIQKSLPIGIKGKPSATDLYLGGTLARYFPNGSTYLLTGNLKDYPMPIYTREAIIPLFNNTDMKGVAVVGIDMDTLVE
ncbi:MAG TPA: hypothetical protein VF572_06445 [Candidatus Saccharimonadales bacterium]|jgi:hypothetical protein